jgi:Mrp family chromosome partitioning ATPase
LISSENAILQAPEGRPKEIIPIEFEGIKAMSFGFAAKGKRAVMRGPMVSSVVNQLVNQTDWGTLDYLVVDMPPGTGDIQITLGQELRFDAAVIVTTPQRLSFIDVVKGIKIC